MTPTKVVHTYTKGDRPRMTAEYVLSRHEQQVIEIRDLILAEQGGLTVLAAAHALSVLLDPDPLFVMYASEDTLVFRDGDLAGRTNLHDKILWQSPGWWWQV